MIGKLTLPLSSKALSPTLTALPPRIPPVTQVAAVFRVPRTVFSAIEGSNPTEKSQFPEPGDQSGVAGLLASTCGTKSGHDAMGTITKLTRRMNVDQQPYLVAPS